MSRRRGATLARSLRSLFGEGEGEGFREGHHAHGGNTIDIAPGTALPLLRWDDSRLGGRQATDGRLCA